MPTNIQNFKNLITYLDKNRIDYAILGRKDSINEIIDGDIDIVVSQNIFHNINNIISDFSTKNDMQLIQCMQHETTAKYFALSDNFNHSIICPDICSSYVRNKRLLIDNKLLIKNRKETTIEGVTFSILNSECEFLYYFLKKIDKNVLEVREFQHLSQQFEKCNQDILTKFLEDYYSNETITIIKDIFNNKKLSKLKSYITIFKKELHKNKTVKIAYAILDLKLKIKRILFKTGLSIAVLGPDGSGKSTVIDGFSKNVIAPLPPQSAWQSRRPHARRRQARFRHHRSGKSRCEQD